MRKIKIEGEDYIPITTGPLNNLVGKIVKKVVFEDDFEIIMLFRDDTAVRFYHDQDCCEDVHIEEVAGDWTSLYGHPLLVAEERTENEERTRGDDIQWTFYTFRNIGGTVDVRWYGSSNGYYSVDVSHKFYGKEQIDIKDCM